MNLTPMQMLDAFDRLMRLQENEVMSRALREMNIRKQPWYKRPLYRFRNARGFRKAWKTQMAQNYKRLAKINAREQAEPEAAPAAVFSNTSAN